LGCRHKFLGILNGLDESLWNPSQDAALPATYTVENLSGKSICKTALQQRLGLPPADYSLPLVGCIGFEMSELELKLMRAALECTLGKSAQVIRSNGFQALAIKKTDLFFGKPRSHVDVQISQ
jgi:starch synthase